MRRFALVAASALLFASPVTAQDITSSWTSSQLLLNAEKDAWAAPECVDAARWSLDCPNPRPSRPADKAQSNAADAPAAPVAGDAAFRFTPSPERRRRNFAAFLARSRAVDPAGAAELEKALSLDIIGMVGQHVRPIGLRTDDVADATAIYVIEAWSAANGKVLAPDRARAQAVRRQMVRAISAVSGFLPADDAARQEMAEGMIVQAALIGSAFEQAMERGDATVIAAVREAAVKGAKATFGMDLRELTMTEAGLREKQATTGGDR